MKFLRLASELEEEGDEICAFYCECFVLHFRSRLVLSFNVGREGGEGER